MLKKVKNNIFLCFSILCFFVFLICVHLEINQSSNKNTTYFLDRVVINAPILTVLYGGDNYLAANLETIRISASSYNYITDELDTFYLIRSQHEITKLNPCNENNYYFANAFLSHGGAVSETNQILVKASNCRFWDGVPAFLYGTNEVFFNNNIDEAIKAFTLSAQRWDINQIALNNMVTSLKSKKFNDAEQALAFLQHEYQIAKDERSKKGLLRRIERVKLLVSLRKAQQQYEEQFGKLQYIKQLVEKQIITEIPQDPLGLGFEFINNRIEFKQIHWSN